MKKEEFMALGLSEELATKAEEASKNELENYVLKSDYDRIKTAKKLLEDDVKQKGLDLENLKKDVKSVEELNTKISDLQKDYEKKEEKYQNDLKELRFNHSLEKALGEARAKNGKVVKAILDLEKLKLNEDGSITGLEEQIKKAQESDAYLFDLEDQGTGSQGNFGRRKENQKNPWKKESFNLTEQSRLFKEEPELAKSLMALAQEN